MRNLLAVALLSSSLFLSGAALPGQPPADWRYPSNGNSNWDPSWNRRPNPRSGACFFTSARFSGNHFCVTQGDRLPRLPGNFGDNISSIQLYGRTRVVVYNDRNYTGGSAEFRSSIPDLRTRRFRASNTWNNRISSIAVR